MARREMLCASSSSLASLPEINDETILKWSSVIKLPSKKLKMVIATLLRDISMMLKVKFTSILPFAGILQMQNSEDATMKDETELSHRHAALCYVPSVMI